jgi:hypothetical protein
MRVIISFFQKSSRRLPIGNNKGMVMAIILMLVAVLVILGTTGVLTVTTDMKISSNYRENARALYNAEAGVEAVMAYLRSTPPSGGYPTSDADPAVIQANTNCQSPVCALISITYPSGFTNTNFYGHTAGNSTVYIYGKDVTGVNKTYVFRMTGTGYNNASRTIETYIRKKTTAPQNADGAVAMYGGDPQVAFKVGGGGGYAIDGHDYPVPASFPCTGGGCTTTATALPAVPGLFTVMPPDTSGNVSAHLGGVPTQTLGPSREEEFNIFADSVIASGSYQTTLGTRTSPAVTVIPNGSTLNGNGNGAGIIIVEDGGAVNISGTFTFEGLIILRGTGRVFGAGTGNIFGSLVTVSHETKLIDLTGGINLFYSSAALANLANISALSKPERLAWRDVQ